MLNQEMEVTQNAAARTIASVMEKYDDKRLKEGVRLAITLTWLGRRLSIQRVR